MFNKSKYENIAEKIIALKNADLAFRDQLIKNKILGQGYNEEMEQLHNHNAEKLNVIINQIGYPSIDKVGKEASEAAWLIIQHSISKPDFMRTCAVLLEKAVIEKKANPLNLAYLNDRIAVFEGKPQKYGIQFDWDENGELSPQFYNDLTEVNQNRKAIGLNTLEEQTEIIRKQARTENQFAPLDLEQNKDDINEWRKKVGWIK